MTSSTEARPLVVGTGQPYPVICFKQVQHHRIAPQRYSATLMSKEFIFRWYQGIYGLMGMYIWYMYSRLCLGEHQVHLDNGADSELPHQGQGSAMRGRNIIMHVSKTGMYLKSWVNVGKRGSRLDTAES